MIDGAGKAKSGAGGDAVSAAAIRQNSPSMESVRALLASRQFETALELTDVGDLASPPAWLAIARARAFVGLAQWEDAIAVARRFERDRLAPAQLLEVAAEAASGAGDWETAIALLKRALLSANVPRLHFRRGIALFNIQRLDDCIAAMQGAAEAEEFFIRAQTIMTKVHHQRHEAEKLISACKLITARDPGNEFALEHLFRQYLIWWDFCAARECYETLSRGNPTKFPIAMYEFMALERAGRFCDALAPYWRAPAWKELTDDFKERIAQLFYVSGSNEQALAVSGAIADQEIVKQFELKVQLANGSCPNAAEFSVSRDGCIAKSLSLYLSGEYDRCVQEVNAIPRKPSDRLALENFRNLAKTRTLISNRLFHPSHRPRHDTDTLPVVQQLWVGGRLSNVERLSIRSFLSCGHVVHLYAYDGDIGAPAGCLVKDAREILPESRVFAHSSVTGRNRGSFAGFADMFRWKLIHEKGGAWADCDLICLEPIRSSPVISTELGRVGNVVMPFITNCFFAAESGEAAFRRAFEQLEDADADNLLWGEAGIHKMADIAASEGWGDRLASPTDFCPIPPFRIVDALMGAFDVEAVIEATKCRAVHLYNEMIRDVGLDKNGPFPANGLVSYLERRVKNREIAFGLV